MTTRGRDASHVPVTMSDRTAAREERDGEGRPRKPAAVATIVLAAGRGPRVKSGTPKHLHPLLSRRLVDWVLEAARPLGPERLLVVASAETAPALGGVEVAIQERPLGTGDAVASAR